MGYRLGVGEPFPRVLSLSKYGSSTTFEKSSFSSTIRSTWRALSVSRSCAALKHALAIITAADTISATRLGVTIRHLLYGGLRPVGLGRRLDTPLPQLFCAGPAPPLHAQAIERGVCVGGRPSPGNA